MDMARLTFDPYDFIQNLKESGISEGQARAIVLGLQRFGLTHVATKDDIAALREDITALRTEMLRSFKEIYRWALPLVVGQLAAFGVMQSLMYQFV